MDEQGHAIVHLTDIHFPPGGARPAWARALVLALEKLAKDDRIQIVGLAVTGDLVNSPNADLFLTVRSFLEQAAIALGLKATPPETPAAGDGAETAASEEETTKKKEPAKEEADWARIWIIDGNHDYRRWGLFKSNWLGIEEGQHLRRFQRYPAEGQVKPILVLGLNSSDEGRAARGRVRLEGLRAVQRQGEKADDGFKYRVALVHHHLLPLPDRPPEFDDTRVQKLKRKIYDESTKLLSNAGLVTNILLESSIDLVLHGHEHKKFAASVKYHDRAGQIMAVVGGPAAKDGFQVVTFAASGDTELTRYELDGIDYKIAARFLLWSYEDWKRVSWERLRRKDGYFRKAERRSELSETGDFQQSSDVSYIFGGEKDIKEIVIINKPDDPISGVVAFKRVRDKSSNDDVDDAKLPPPGKELRYPIVLAPPAKLSAPHPGYVAVRVSSDNFLLMREEMAMRRPDGPFREATRFHYPHPVEQLRVTLDFPTRFAPRSVEATARLHGKMGAPEDVAETLRMRRNIFYDAKKGQVWLSLDWVSPNHQYEIAWDLPSEADTNENDATIGASYLKECLALSPSSLTFAADVLDKLRQLVFEKLLAHGKISAAHAHAFEPGELSIWAYDEAVRLIRPIAGTYQARSPFWNARLAWASGIRGRALRRRLVEYCRRKSTSIHTNFYHRLENCDEETHLLCVPILLPPSEKKGVCKMVAVLASTKEGSLLHHLHDIGFREKIAELIFFEISDLVKKIIPSPA